MKKEIETEQPKQLQASTEQPQSTAVQTVTQKFGLSMDRNGNLDLPSLGVVLSQSGFFSDIQKASQGMVKVMLGRELGIPAITAVVGIHILTNSDGKVTVMIGSHLKAGKIKKSGCYDYDIIEASATRCELIPKVKNDEGKWEKKTPVIFTIEQAKQMRLGGYGKDGATNFKASSNWAKAPEDMLFHRCLGRMEKMHFPDISTVPTYTPDELGFREDEKGEAVIVEGSLVRDEDDSKVKPTPETTEGEQQTQQPQPTAKRVKANAVQLAKLQATSKKFKWEQPQFFDMVIREKAVTDQDAAKEAMDQQNWKALLELLAGDDEAIETVLAKLAMGYDLYLDAATNTPDADSK